MTGTTATPPTTNRTLSDWVERWARILQPNDVHWCDGSEHEYEELCARLVDSGTFTPGTSADSKGARTVANTVFWDMFS